MSEPVVIFVAHNDMEATIVAGLLESHGIPTVPSSRLSRSVFPVNVNELGEVRLAVSSSDADAARQLIGEHQTTIATGQVVPLREEFQSLERSLQYRFRDRGLLEQALTHTSKANEDPSGGATDNESLEFLGDAVLGFLVADMLYREWPDSDEGQKSKAKAALVSAATLSRLAEQLAVGRHLLLGRGEEKTGGRTKHALLSDAYEALIAAIYLDGGLEHARAFVRRDFLPLVELARGGAIVGQDHKSALQERLQQHDAALPEYRLIDAAGPDHRKAFHVGVWVDGVMVGDATATSKKEAEQLAARQALARLDDRGRA